MDSAVLVGGRLLDPEAEAPLAGSLLLAGDRIAGRLRPDEPPPPGARVVDLRGLAIAPGFLDLHYHGPLIFSAPAGARAALAATSRKLLATGVTGFLPTTVAWPADELSARVEAWSEAAAQLRDPPDGAAALGLHLEGPWIRPEAAGAQPKQGIRPFQRGEAALLDRAAGLVRMVTLAPEAEGADALLAELARRGIVAALGHTLADAGACARAVASGARHVTHLFNAMGAFHHRAPGLIGTALTDDRLSCDLICDGVHVADAAVRLAARAKGERLALITDNVEIPTQSDRASAFASFGAGAVRDDGVALRLADGSLAGSRLTLDGALANVQACGALDLLGAVRALSLVPARILGLERERGSLRAGARADLTVLDAANRIVETWRGGRCAYHVQEVR